MYSPKFNRDIERLESFLGNSHRCLACGDEFLAHSDRCPGCGNYNMIPLDPVKLESKEWDMESYPVRVFDPKDISACFTPINIGDFSPWPRT